MKKVLVAISIILCAVQLAGAVQINVAPKGVNSKIYTSQSVCGLELAPSSRMWMATQCSLDGKSSFICLNVSDNGGKNWTEAIATVNSLEGETLSCATLWNDPDGKLWMFFSANRAPSFDGRGTLYAAVCANPSDKVPSWSAPREIGYGFVTDKPVIGKGGVWVLPYSLWGRKLIDGADRNTAYSELDSHRGAGVIISADGGNNWKIMDAVVTPPSNAQRRNDATLVNLPGGLLRMIVRSSDNVLTCDAWEYFSKNNGASWFGGGKFVDNPDRRICVTRLSDGRLLMVKNGYFDRLNYIIPYNLVCYLSDDNGDTWYGEMRVSSDGKAVNPYAVDDGKGNICIAYDHDSAVAGEICMLTTTAKDIEAVYGNIDHEDSPGKVVLKAGKCASSASAALKSEFAPRKNWADETLRIGTYNIQYRNSQWTQKRLPALEALLAEYKFDIFGSQEPFATQIADMMKMDFGGVPFADVYAFIGKPVSGRDDDTACHLNPIFYRKDRLELVDWGIEWFTDCPGKAGFGAYSSRQCCWGRFRDKKSGKEFYCFNCHPDHLGQEAREQSSVILVDAIRRISGGLPSFLTGDFNAREDTPSYNILMESGFLDDSLLSVYNPVNAEYFSMSDYKPMDTVKKDGKHIDHIFYTPHASKILSWELITHSFNNYFGSDHLPIICEWKIAN